MIEMHNIYPCLIFPFFVAVKLDQRLVDAVVILIIFRIRFLLDITAVRVWMLGFLMMLEIVQSLGRISTLITRIAYQFMF